MDNNKKLLMIIGGAAAIVVAIVAVVLVNIFTDNRSMVCKLVNDQEAMGYKVETIYTVYGSDAAVSRVLVQHKVKSEDEELKNSLVDVLKEQFEYNNEHYGGYSYNVNENSDTEVILDGEINYRVTDMSKFSSDNVAIKEYLNENNKLSFDGIKRLYQSSGAVCEE